MEIRLLTLPISFWIFSTCIPVSGATEICQYSNETVNGNGTTSINGTGDTYGNKHCEEGCCGDTKETVCCKPKHKSDGLGGGEIAAIIIGCYFGLMVISIIIIKIVAMQKKKQHSIQPDYNSNVQYICSSDQPTSNPVSSTDEANFDISTTPYPRQNGVCEPYMFVAESKEDYVARKQTRKGNFQKGLNYRPTVTEMVTDYSPKEKTATENT